MAYTNIYPYGQNEEMPTGYPIANDLNTNSAQQGLSAAMGKKLAAIARKRAIIVAASNASDEEKLAADYQCTGTNDELAIQQAVDAVYAMGGGTVLLSSGTFSIDSFPTYDSANDGGSYVAVQIPWGNTLYSICIMGNPAFNNAAGTRILVSDACYNGLSSSNKYKVFSSTYSASLMSSARVFLSMYNIRISLPWNQKKIMCIDLHSVNRAYLQFISLSAARDGFGGWVSSVENPPAVAVQGCIGIRMTGGSNAGQVCDYRNIGTYAFNEGIQVGGEHVIGVNLSGICNVYSFTFGNYPFSNCFIHPITLINCCDERTVNYPLFASNGDNGANTGQPVTLIDYNIERYATITPGKQLGELATESSPGRWYGELTYTIMTDSSNSTNEKFWKDGHGQRFNSRNSAHQRACATSVRNGYAPNYLQRIWDTTLNKEVICTNTATKEWRDAMGNIV